jgi:hypothetical protein
MMIPPAPPAVPVVIVVIVVGHARDEEAAMIMVKVLMREHVSGAKEAWSGHVRPYAVHTHVSAAHTHAAMVGERDQPNARMRY